jgi:diguanylate cyclase (GGDEF)-like protein
MVLSCYNMCNMPHSENQFTYFPDADEREAHLDGFFAGEKAAQLLMSDLFLQHYSEVDRLTQLAEFDQDTGLLNKRAWKEKVQSRIEDASEDGEIGLLFIDIDDFSEINNRLGHDTGDAFIKAIADKLKDRFMRKDDEIAHEKLINPKISEDAGRWGGDEFAITCDLRPRSTSSNTENELSPEEQLGQRLINLEIIKNRVAGAFFELLEEHPDIKGLGVGASIGTAFWRKGMAADQLFKQADDSMYAVKALKKSKIPAN